MISRVSRIQAYRVVESKTDEDKPNKPALFNLREDDLAPAKERILSQLDVKFLKSIFVITYEMNFKN